MHLSTVVVEWLCFGGEILNLDEPECGWLDGLRCIRSPSLIGNESSPTSVSAGCAGVGRSVRQGDSHMFTVC